MPADRTEKGQFAPGNQVNTTHGGRSDIARKAMRLRLRQDVRDLVTVALPELQPGDAFLVDLLVSALADVRQITDWLDERGGPMSEQGRPYKAVEMLTTRERRAMELLDRLGIGPRARGQLLGSVRDLAMQATMAAAAQERIRAKLGAAGTSNGHAGHLRASELPT